ncbi:hypothetical protein EJB05_24607 [Eragrostis curvula]|uniref:Uncharacterized protein n=1 Tax=Eragrostis curvula TaxID=38414 RepID=A0A5J9VB37_9POAL|nr:hypothetical protein EJB05_24607 [Eragrostis curvula]
MLLEEGRRAIWHAKQGLEVCSRWSSRGRLGRRDGDSGGEVAVVAVVRCCCLPNCRRRYIGEFLPVLPFVPEATKSIWFQPISLQESVPQGALRLLLGGP